MVTDQKEKQVIAITVKTLSLKLGFKTFCGKEKWHGFFKFPLPTFMWFPPIGAHGDNSLLQYLMTAAALNAKFLR